jgi:hypothetical protein
MSFSYHSVQTHREFINGKGHSNTYKININNKKGYKSVSKTNATGTTSSKKKLTPSEISHIRKSLFYPVMQKRLTTNKKKRNYKKSKTE